MTALRFSCPPERDLFGVEALGHAASPEKCAAYSAVLTGLLAGLLNLPEVKILRGDLTPGRAVIRWKPVGGTPETESACRAAFALAYCSLKQIEEA